MFLEIKSKIMAMGAVVGVLMIGVIKFLSIQNKQLKSQNKVFRADQEYQNDIDELESELRQKFSRRAKKAKEALDNDQIPENLRDPRD
jgi:uncharacterized membrane-anchored protein YhcB (DUF1043 family)